MRWRDARCIIRRNNALQVDRSQRFLSHAKQSIDQRISQQRKKIEKASKSRGIIETIHNQPSLLRVGLIALDHSFLPELIDVSVKFHLFSLVYHLLHDDVFDRFELQCL